LRDYRSALRKSLHPTRSSSQSRISIAATTLCQNDTSNDKILKKLNELNDNILKVREHTDKATSRLNEIEQFIHEQKKYNEQHNEILKENHRVMEQLSTSVVKSEEILKRQADTIINLQQQIIMVQSELSLDFQGSQLGILSSFIIPALFHTIDLVVHSDNEDENEKLINDSS